MPQRNVLERRMRVAAQQAREPGDLLAPYRVSFVGHRGGAFLTFPERLLHLSDFGLLEAAHFERELLQRRARDRDRREQLRMAVALNDLRGDRRRLEPELAADVRLDGRIEVREGADR